MSLIEAILKKAASKELKEDKRKYTSPPPEVDESVLHKKLKMRKHRYSQIQAVVDSTPPFYNEQRMYRKFSEWRKNSRDIHLDNVRLVLGIVSACMSGGKVDSHWSTKMAGLTKQYHENRIVRHKEIKRENKVIYKRLLQTRPRVKPTAALEREWAGHKTDIIHMSKKKFVLFPVTIEKLMEDPLFATSKDFQRPKVYITLEAHGPSTLGTLEVELFTDICPNSCQLFLELVDGRNGFGYVGTRFFRKVPNLYWCGGDVVYNNGFGCYAQSGRVRPIPAENFHFSHSMPGLLSMPVSSEGYLCGVFNITFKTLPQFDLRNVVFGRILRPCVVYDAIRTLGSPLSSQPVVEISATRRKIEGRWIIGSPNTQLRQRNLLEVRKNCL